MATAGRKVINQLKLVSQKSNDEIDHLLDKFHLTDKRNSWPIELSGGQRRRVSIIQQLLCSSGFILMDEPFSGLDVIMKQKTIDTILDVSTEQELNTIIVTTHDIETAVAISDTIWILGRKKDEQGNILPGATCVKQICMIERGFAWNKDVQKHHNFYPTVLEIKDLFKNL